MKNKNPKQKNTTDINEVTLSNVGKKIIKPTFWTVLVVAGLWSLMHFSTPETKLEPYTKFQKTSATFENNLDVEIKPGLERFTETKQPDFTNISSQNPGPTPTGNQLPRKTLEPIQKGMQLIEEVKFHSADMEFEKAAQISPNAPEVFALRILPWWGTALRAKE